MPELEALASENKDKAVYLKVEIEENEEIAQGYQVEALPTLICLKNKEKIGVMHGSKIENFKNFVSKNLG